MTTSDAGVRRIDVADLTRYVAELFRACGMSEDDARVQAECIIFANLRGHDSHGVSSVAGYIRCLREGRINAHPKVTLDQRTPACVLVNGDNGMGHVVAKTAMDAAISCAARIGIGLALVHSSNHFGAASTYTLQAVDEDCIGIAIANTSPAVAPWGGKQKLFGTNPISVAVPGGAYGNYVMDMATSAVARLKIREAEAKGWPIPEGWALDSDGRPTTSPDAALSGSLLPCGGHKGSATAMLFDILAGALSGAGFAGSVLSFVTNTTTQPANNGNFLMAIRVDPFMKIDAFRDRMDELYRMVKQTPRAPDYGMILVPGERGDQISLERKQAGVPVSEELVGRLNRVGTELSITSRL